MAFSSPNIQSISMGLEGVAVGAAERCVPFLSKELTGMSIADSQDAYEDLREERIASGSALDDMDWEPSSEVVIPTVPAKVNPFLGAAAASKPVVTAKVNPFLDAPAVSTPVNPVNPFLSQPASISMPVEMDIDEWSINDHTNTNANARPARNNKRQNKGRGRGKATKSNNGGSHNTSQKSNGGAAGFIGNYKVTQPSSNSETRRGGNNKNNNSSRRRSNNGNKNRSQRH